MDNNFLEELSCWPFRCIGLDIENKIEYISKPKNAEYDIIDLYDYIKNHQMMKFNI